MIRMTLMLGAFFFLSGCSLLSPPVENSECHSCKTTLIAPPPSDANGSAKPFQPPARWRE